MSLFVGSKKVFAIFTNNFIPFAIIHIVHNEPTVKQKFTRTSNNVSIKLSTANISPKLAVTFSKRLVKAWKELVHNFSDHDKPSPLVLCNALLEEETWKRRNCSTQAVLVIEIEWKLGERNERSCYTGM